MSRLIDSGILVNPVEQYLYPRKAFGVTAGGNYGVGGRRHDLRSYRARLDSSNLLSEGFRFSVPPEATNSLVAKHVVTLRFVQAPDIQPAGRISCFGAQAYVVPVPVNVSATLKGWDLYASSARSYGWAGVGVECWRAAWSEVRALEVSRRSGWAGSWRKTPWTSAGVVSGIVIKVTTEIA